MSLARICNSLWSLSCQPSGARFRHACRNVAGAQQEVLREILGRNQLTEYGRKHQFAASLTPERFQQDVPVVDYDSLRPWVDRIAAGESGVLTADPVRLLEPTSGCSSGEKLIPYTDILRRQFGRAVDPWIRATFAEYPRASRGRGYWSISPLRQRDRRTRGGLPIGFEDDRDYLSGWQRRLVNRVVIVPPGIRRTRTMDAARYLTLLALVAAEDLSLISVWSPTFLTQLFDDLHRYGESLVRSLVDARINPPAEIRDQFEGTPGTVARASQSCIRRLERMLERGPKAPDGIAQLWPRLALVSCWGDASSWPYFVALRARLRGVEVQRKGLLSTEAVVSFPIDRCSGSVLAVRSHFFEFLPIDSSEKPRSTECCLAHQLDVGQRYEVVVTTGGGLYRYRLGDVVEVEGYVAQAPCLRFCGRGSKCCDLVGEKLTEAFVQKCIDRVWERLGLSMEDGSSMMVVPRDAPSPGYALLIQSSQRSRQIGELLARNLDDALAANPQYALARECGQLAPVELHLLPENAWRRYEAMQLRRGVRGGDIKPVALDPWPGWIRVLESPVSEALPNDIELPP